MELLEAIEKLARTARQETTPATDINVHRLIGALRPEPSLRIAPFAWSAAISALAACVMLSIALHTSGSTKSASSVDSISPLFNATQVQMP